MYQQNVTSVPAVVILWLVTCGIYGFIWIYQTARAIKDYTGDPQLNPGLDVLLCVITCGIYQLYWFYRLSQRIQDCGEIARVPTNDNALVFLLLSLFGMTVVAAAIAQSDLNRIWETA